MAGKLRLGLIAHVKVKKSLKNSCPLLSDQCLAPNNCEQYIDYRYSGGKQHVRDLRKLIM